MVRVSVPTGAWGRVGCLYEERDLEGVVGEPSALQWNVKHLCSHHLFLLGHHWLHLSRDTWGAEPGPSDRTSWAHLPASPSWEGRHFFAVEDANHHFWSVQGCLVQAPGSGEGSWLLSPSPSLSSRHEKVLPRYPHDAGLQTRALLQSLLDDPVPGNNDGNCSLEVWDGELQWCQYPWMTSPCKKLLC